MTVLWVSIKHTNYSMRVYITIMIILIIIIIIEVVHVIMSIVNPCDFGKKTVSN